MMRVYYFGDARVTGDHGTGPWLARGDVEPGHYLRRPMPVTTSNLPGVSPTLWDGVPWSVTELDSRLAGDPALVERWGDGIDGKGTVPHWRSEDQPEGVVRLHHRDGWTAISFWDRTGDRRGSSNSTFIAEGMHDAPQMLTLFAESFPAIWARITAKVQLVEHPGNPRIEGPAPRARIEAPRVRIAAAEREHSSQITIADVAEIEAEPVPPPRRVAMIAGS